MQTMMKRLMSLAAGVGLCLISGVSSAADDADRGAILYRQCAPCHSFYRDTDQAGPSLRGVFGRQAGTLEDYPYSEAMKRSGIIWTEETIKAWISDPLTFIPGSRKRGHTLYDDELLDDLMAYLARAQAR